MSQQRERAFVSRAGAKLAFGLDHFGIDPSGAVCADLGSNVGGFVDCLLRRGAKRVYAIDTAYGVLDWSLRNDSRVVVMERTSALEATIRETVPLVTVDVGWTRQHLVLPRAVEMTAPGGCVVSLIKPQYEAEPGSLKSGILPDELVEPTVARVVQRLACLGITVCATVASPIRGDGGNREILALVQPR